MPRPPNTDPVILALFAKLPRAGNVWPLDDRKRWLEAVDAALKYLYPNGEANNGDTTKPSESS